MAALSSSDEQLVVVVECDENGEVALRTSGRVNFFSGSIEAMLVCCVFDEMPEYVAVFLETRFVVNFVNSVLVVGVVALKLDALTTMVGPSGAS